MARKKMDRLVVPGADEVSKKALASQEFVHWGGEPKWSGIDFFEIAKENWNSYESDERPHRFPDQIAEFADLPWMALSEDQRVLVVERAIDGFVHTALNWYNAVSDDGKIKKYFMEYVAANHPDHFDHISKIGETSFRTHGAIARILALGCPKVPKYVNHLKSKVQKLITQATAEEAAPPIRRKKVEVVRDPKMDQIIGIIEGMIDDYGLSLEQFPQASLSDCVLVNGGTAKHLTLIKEHYLPLANEMSFAITGKDEEIAEAYLGSNKKMLNHVVDWILGIPSQVLVQSVASVRKKRKKKAKSAASILKHLEVLASFSELGIRSIDREDILGAQQLWVYDTVKRKLGVYNALDSNGLGVARKSITNFDEETSIVKKVRKPVEIVPHIVKCGKVDLRHAMEKIGTVAVPLNSRINSNMVLLRIVK